MEKISVVILNWKRPENTVKIVSSLRANELVDDIVIWNDNPSAKILFPEPINKVKIIESNYNFGLYDRWYAALLAENDAVFIQDDDLILSGKAIKTLFDEWKKDPEVIHGIWGNMPQPWDLRYYGSKTDLSEAETVLTRALVFHKKYIYEILKKAYTAGDYLKNTIKKNGEDIFMSYVVMSIAGRRNKIHDLCDEVEELPCPYAISSDSENHLEVRTNVLRACRKEFHIRFSMKERMLIVLYRIAAYLKRAHPALHSRIKK